MLLCFVYFFIFLFILFIYLLIFFYFIFLFYFFLLFFFWSFLYSVIRYSLSSPPRIAMRTAGYNGLCNLTQVNKVCVCVNKQGRGRGVQADIIIYFVVQWVQFDYSDIVFGDIRYDSCSSGLSSCENAAVQYKQWIMCG